MNIAYLILFEHLNSSIIRGQVVEFLKELRKHLQEIEKLYLISFLALYWFLTHRKDLSDLKEELRKADVHLVVIPVLHFVQMFYAKWYQIPLAFFQTFSMLFYFSATRNIRLFHCRSYPITLSALAVKKLKDVKVIFDPRSDFPEENITNGNWSETSFDFKMWKYFEKRFCKYADGVIAITETYVKHFQNIEKSINVYTIPNNVDTEKFIFDAGFRKEYRQKHNLKDRLIFCYSGSMAKNSWNNPEEYAEVIPYLKNLLDEDCLFLFLIPEDSKKILLEVFKDNNVDSDAYLIEHPAYKEVPKCLSAADIGIYFLDRYSIRMGTKFVEYCSVGLPVLVNDYVGGAKYLVEQYKLGISLDFGLDNKDNRKVNRHDVNVSLMENLIDNKEKYARRCRSFAKKKFSNEIVAKKCADMYRELILEGG